MRRSLPLIALLLASGCGQGGGGGGEQAAEREPTETRTFEVSEDAMSSTDTASLPGITAPKISPTAAPGVAFNYRYAFRLPAASVSAVQEQHAQACEKLGINRCRITGMRYRLRNESDIEAMLAFKLDPAVARQFGKLGVEAVARAEGMLIDSEISGEDAGSAIKAANLTDAELNEDLRRIEAQLARPGLKADERQRLDYDAQQIRQSIRANRDQRSERQESLATTPMVFQYGSGDLVPGFDSRSPLASALDRAGENFMDGVGLLIVLVVSLLPWALLLLLGWWIARKLRTRFGHRFAPAEA